MRLISHRRNIDEIDGKIIELLNKRAKVTLEVRKIKKGLKKSVYTPHREKEVYERVLKNSKGPLSAESLKAIYREVMSGSLALEKPLGIAYLGPEATFTHIAALKKFGRSLSYIECKSIGEVFTEVERGRADYGVVPIENSTEGAVNYTLDMFINSTLKICSEIYLPIEHNLLSKKASLKAIKKVCSHEQVFAQCRIWLEKNLPNVKLATYASTTQAAVAAKSENKCAAIASELAAKKYGLNVLARSIEDSSRNVTRFLVIGKELTEPSGGDKTSIVFSLKDKIGVLHDALIPLKRNKINLTKIESRPSPQKAWEYYFFVDMEGHYKDRKLQKALKQLEKSCVYFKILGSYPVGK